MGATSTITSATFENMVRLGDLTQSVTEKAGHEPTTHFETFDGRTGYSKDFLNGWSIPLPMPPADDIRRVRHGADAGDPVLRYEHFSVVMSASRRLPSITAVNIDGSQSVKHVPRETVWAFDGRLDKDDQWGDEIYDRNDLDRGHMVRREDPIWGDRPTALQANKDTFHFTNSVGQMAGVNQKVWLGLENYILQNARVDGMLVNVYTGPFFSDYDHPYRNTLVPLAFWKVVAIVTEDGRRSATAYKVSQEKELSDLEFVYAGYKTFQISIRQVQEATGIDFSELIPFDGFSEYESRRGEVIEEKLEKPENIRI